MANADVHVCRKQEGVDETSEIFKIRRSCLSKHLRGRNVLNVKFDAFY